MNPNNSHVRSGHCQAAQGRGKHTFRTFKNFYRYLPDCTSQTGLATSLIYDNTLVEKLKTDLEAEELYVNIVNSGTLLLTNGTSSFDTRMEKMALATTNTDTLNIHSPTYLWDDGHLQMIKKYRS